MLLVASLSMTGSVMISETQLLVALCPINKQKLFSDPRNTIVPSRTMQVYFADIQERVGQSECRIGWMQGTSPQVELVNPSPFS